MAAYFKTMDIEQLRIFAMEIADKETLLDVFVQNGSKEDILRVVDTKFIDNYIRKLIKMGDTAALSNIFAVIPDVLANNHEFINIASTQRMVNLLLENGISLDKVKMIIPSIETFVLIAARTIKFKVPFNPNRKMSKRNDMPFWRDLAFERIITSGILTPIASWPEQARNNLSEPIDVNAQSNEGLTLLHICGNIPDEFLRLNPDPEIKNINGQTPLEYRRKYDRECSALIKYIATRTSSKITTLSSFTTKEDKNQELLDKIKELEEANDILRAREKKNADLLASLRSIL